MDDDVYRAPQSPVRAERMFGGQFLAQAIASGQQTVTEDRFIHSLHAYFLRPGDTLIPVDFHVSRTRDGRSYSNRQITAYQHGKAVFSLIASYAVPLESPCYSGRNMAAVPSPEDVTYTYEQFCREQMPDPDYEREVQSRPMDIRYINAPMSREQIKCLDDQLMWIRITTEVGDQAWQHTAGVAYIADSTLVDHVVLPHGKRWQDSDFDGTSLDHAMWFHRHAKADEWLLFEQSVEWTGDSRGFTSGRLFDRSGELVASCAQEGLMRFR